MQSGTTPEHGGTDYTSAADAFRKIYAKEGLAGLYAGLGSGLGGTIVSSFSYFYIYSTVRGAWIARMKSQAVSTGAELSLGAVAGALCQLIVLPIGIATTRQQTDNVARTQSFFAVISGIVRQEGLQGLWRGLRASLVLCVNPAITYVVCRIAMFPSFICCSSRY